MKSAKLKKLITKKNRTKKNIMSEDKELQKWKDFICDMIQREAFTGASVMIEERLRKIAKEKSDRIIDLRTENIN